ncbi:hypothetical protein [Streptomyces ossamyceticus]|uniref:hypothetical protein n=1 Tax=Streptomyces ossamyceticus TaxID=249581 RepID=UPI0006E261EF|nr:hypothetical protein [Streptomyces ossamyceticus]
MTGPGAPSSRPAARTRYLAAFWEAALGDHELTAQALRTLHSWILTAGRARQPEVAPASLLPALTGTPAKVRRRSRGEHRSAPLPAAVGLLAGNGWIPPGSRLPPTSTRPASVSPSN